MEISSNGLVCGNDTGYVHWITGNPGEPATVYPDTDCDRDSYITIDTARAGRGLYDDDGNHVAEAGYATPKRTYRDLEFVIDRAWDDQRAFNVSHTLAYSEGNAEGPVNSDTDFADPARSKTSMTPGSIATARATCRTTGATRSSCAARTASESERRL